MVNYKQKTHNLLEASEFYTHDPTTQMKLLLEAFGGALTTRQANTIGQYVDIDFKPRTMLRHLERQNIVWTDRPFAPQDLTLRWMLKK